MKTECRCVREYEKIGVIGEGHGVMIKARRKGTKRLVCIKKIKVNAPVAPPAAPRARTQ